MGQDAKEGRAFPGPAWDALGGLCWVTGGGAAPGGAWGALTWTSPPPPRPPILCCEQSSQSVQHFAHPLPGKNPAPFSNQIPAPKALQGMGAGPVSGSAPGWGRGREKTLPTWMRHACQSLRLVAPAHRP